MKLSRKCGAIKKDFGKFLKSARLESDRTLFDNGYVLRVSPQTVFLWEAGFSFPRSIVTLKKLAMMYEDVPGFLKDAVSKSGIGPSFSEWKHFEKDVYSGGGKLVSGIRPNYESADERDSEYKRAFGRYMLRERHGRGITPTAMARAFGTSVQSYCAWENGSAWPQEAMVLVLMDRLYGNTFDVLFGLCKKNGIHLSLSEKKDVLRRSRMFEGTSRCERGNGRFRELDWR